MPLPYWIGEQRSQKTISLENMFLSFTMGDKVEGVTLKGFKYPLKDHTLVNSDEIGVSNEILEEKAEITFRSGVVLMIMSKDRNIQ